ncbi:MAG TPA: hypothetical protein VGH33_13690 [Isosphaeraceae bacterium]
MRRLSVLSSVVAVLAAPAPSPGQQVADPTFDAKVARPAYTERHPRVLFDEAHHNFHTTVGRYKPFADLIASDGYRVTPGRARFTREVLREADVLVIANALGAESIDDPDASRPAFTEDECQAVHDWVRAGGALLLVTDLPPMGSPAEGLGKRFGVDMSKGITTDLANSEPRSASFLIFSRENGLLGDHAITRGRDASERVETVTTFTGQSLTGPEGAFAFLRLADTASDEDPRTGTLVRAGGRAQGLAFRLGRGRVVVLGEAGQLSAQVTGPQRRPMGMNVPGVDNCRLALNIMHWLSGLIEPGQAPRGPRGP